MTRRKFFLKFIKAASLIVAGASWLGKKASPRKFVRAIGIQKYPGPVKPPGNIREQSKWSG